MNPRIIVFTGIDGAGKSSHARALAALLRGRGEAAACVHQFSPESALVGRLRAALWTGLKRAKALVARPGRPGAAAWAAARATLLLGFLRTAVKLRRGRGGALLVFDRYFADEVLRVRFDYGASPPWAGRLEALLPSPDLVFYLDLPPEEALAREKDGDLDPVSIRRKKELYDRWFRGAASLGRPPVIRLRTDRDADEVREEVAAHALHVLASRGRLRAAPPALGRPPGP